MPISLNQVDASDILEVVVNGKLTHADYEEFQPEFERVVKKKGRVRLLLDMVDFHGWEVGALWDDTKFVFQHFSDIERIAMVGDKTWEEGMSKVCRAFTSAEIRYFDWKELVAAREWLEAREGSNSNSANSKGIPNCNGSSFKEIPGCNTPMPNYPAVPSGITP